MDELNGIPVGGIKDWAKGKVKDVLLSYAKPYWDELKAAVQNRDYGKLAELVDKVAALAGYVEVGTAISEVLREVAAGNYFVAAEKGYAAIKMIVALFPKPSPAPSPTPKITVGAAGDPVTHDIVSFVDDLFDPTPTTHALTATADGSESEPELGPDGKPVQFGIIEIAAIVSIAYTVRNWIKARRQQKNAA